MANIDKDKVKGIIFDYGGTIDSRGDHWSEVIWDAYRKAGIEVSKEDFRDAYVYAERELARTRHILPHHTFLDLLIIKMRIELHRLADAGLFASDEKIIGDKADEVARYCYESAQSSISEARATFETLQKHYPMVLVSNFYGNVEAVLEDFDLRRYFGDIIESAVVGVRKPDPKIFQLGVDALHLSADETLVIGDSYRKDIEPAESLGCQVLWIKGKGWTPEEDAQMHPNIIRSLTDVTDLLQK